MRRLPLLIPGLLALLPACVAENLRRYDETGAVGVDAPEAWVAPARGESVPAGLWWERFGDAELNALVAEALAHNRDLRAAAARLDAAAAQARIAGAGRMPSADLNLSRNRKKQVFVGLPIGSGAPLESTSTAWGVSLDVSWELDLWGRIAAGQASAEENWRASAEDLAWARQSLAAQTVKGWLAWKEARLQESLAEETVASRARSAQIVRRRYQGGLARPLDVRLAASDVASAEALLEGRREQVARAARQLEILIGRYPRGELVAPAGLPDLPPVPPAGLPGELLVRRPDLRAAEHRLAAADWRLAEARADLLPSLRLVGSAGRLGSETGDLSDGDFDVWGLFAGLTQPVFQGGSLRAAAELADARAREALAAYGAGLLRAYAEVESALVAEELIARRAADLARASQEAQAAERLADQEYSTGVSGLLILLEAQRRELSTRSFWLESRRAHLENRVDLHLALGGDFDPGPPSASSPDSPPSGTLPPPKESAQP